MYWCRVCTAITLFLALVSAAVPRAYPELVMNTTILRLVRDNAVNISTHSWEIGTLAEALTEVEWPLLSAFTPSSLYPPSRLPWWESAYDVLSIAETTINQKVNGTLPLADGQGSVGDPASEVLDKPFFYATGHE